MVDLAYIKVNLIEREIAAQVRNPVSAIHFSTYEELEK